MGLDRKIISNFVPYLFPGSAVIFSSSGKGVFLTALAYPHCRIVMLPFRGLGAINCLKRTYKACLFSCCMKAQGRPPRKIDVARDVTVLVSYCNTFLNPLIYIIHYNVVRRSLVALLQKLAAKFTIQQPPATDWHSCILLVVNFTKIYVDETTDVFRIRYRGPPGWRSRPVFPVGVLMLSWDRRSIYPSIFNHFWNIAIYRWRVINFQQSREVNERFLNHILLSPGYAPGTIAVNVTRLERGFNACKTPLYIHLSTTVSQ